MPVSDKTKAIIKHEIAMLEQQIVDLKKIQNPLKEKALRIKDRIDLFKDQIVKLKDDLNG